jgi:1,4-dihydroxy-2-naphthoate polyprenyltransferase
LYILSQLSKVTTSRLQNLSSNADWRDAMRNSQAPPAMGNLTSSSRRAPMNVSFWLMAARPRTLTLSVTPVMVGTALAWAAESKVHWLAVLAALVGSVFIQLGTNIHNDAADFERGGDGPDRIGPPRVTASGLLTATTVNRGAMVCFAISALLGIYLVFVGGWPILVLGVLSIAAGWGYTGGPLPIAYTPLGELFCVAFLGVGAVGGTYFLCTGHIISPALLTGLAIGSLTGAVLLVNNHRDVVSDARVGRKTLPIVVGPIVTIAIFAGLLLLPFASLPLIGRALPQGQVWPALIALPLALIVIYRFAREPRGPVFNRILVLTVQVQLAFSLLLSIGLML